MTSFTTGDKDRLLELLGEKLKLSETVRDFTERQAKLIEEGDFEKLEESLRGRQEAIDKIDGLHQESSLLMQSFASSAGSGGAGSPEIESADRKLGDVMGECAALNEKNMELLKNKMKDQSEKSERMRQSRESLGLYAQGGSNPAELFDRMT